LELDDGSSTVRERAGRGPDREEERAAVGMERDRELTELAALEDPRSAFHVPDPERGPAAHRDEPTVGGEDDLARLIVELRKNAEEALRLGVVHDRKRAHTRDDPARAPDEI